MKGVWFCEWLAERAMDVDRTARQVNFAPRPAELPVRGGVSSLFRRFRVALRADANAESRCVEERDRTFLVA
ncbi:MAG: hypothetical protein C4334_01695 [Pyrinomonas sp.]